MLKTQQDITFNSGDLALEGTLHLPQETGRLPGVVICHPHPRYSGNMDNIIVREMARNLCDAGMAVLRFNFRGVGASEGDFDGGMGEVEDSIEALSFLSLHDDVDASRIGIAGYSFGAAIALVVSAQSNLVQAVASIACPSRVFSEMGAQEILQPKLLICGEHDHNFPAKQFKFLSQRFSEPKQVELVYGADHFFGGHVSEVTDLVADFFSTWLGQGQG